MSNSPAQEQFYFCVSVPLFKMGIDKKYHPSDRRKFLLKISATDADIKVFATHLVSELFRTEKGLEVIKKKLCRGKHVATHLLEKSILETSGFIGQTTSAGREDLICLGDMGFGKLIGYSINSEEFDYYKEQYSESYYVLDCSNPTPPNDDFLLPENCLFSRNRFNGWKNIKWGNLVTAIDKDFELAYCSFKNMVA